MGLTSNTCFSSSPAGTLVTFAERPARSVVIHDGVSIFGAMLIGGVWTLIQVRGPILHSLRQLVSLYVARRDEQSGSTLLRTERDAGVVSLIGAPQIVVMPVDGGTVTLHPQADIENASALAAAGFGATSDASTASSRCTGDANATSEPFGPKCTPCPCDHVVKNRSFPSRCCFSSSAPNRDVLFR